ncbi:type II toxin-antitoxin system VapC family toxin [Thermofilum sp.]|uniref:type II toxin-antitoxin system VapC family toxin n=1 Tax=Thermofilum sp. TaxID=1961369 RepID=UPI001D4B4D2F|nr:type II toxin-antitoxin system VapC family toxin [Candidatus Brockarchaeota archaeon]MBO3801981.1 type II toxin-antitoxin system VapC family toxin [Candidatus Brockarchaeota archaeon]
MRYIIDSYAWIEYFMGTKAGEKVKPIVEGLEEKITPTICLAEVYAKTIRVEGEKMAEKQRVFIKERSIILPLDEKLAVEAAKIDIAMKRKVKSWGLADSIVYAAGLVKKAEIVTGDEHFKDLENVFFIR